MKVELVISKASKVVAPSNCPNNTQNNCGIMYRAF